MNSPRERGDESSPSLPPLPSLNEGKALTAASWPTWKLLLWALLAGLLVFVIGAGLDWLLLAEHERRGAVIEVSDALAGLVAGALVLRLLQYERERRARLRQRLEVIAEMNHHIRNALQVISLTAASAADQKQLETIRNSMNRIEWALREILPKF